jgi:hypothetical protein
MFFFTQRHKTRKPTRPYQGFRPTLEALEDRMLPISGIAGPIAPPAARAAGIYGGNALVGGAAGTIYLGTAMVGQAATPAEPGQAATGFGFGPVPGSNGNPIVLYLPGAHAPDDSHNPPRPTDVEGASPAGAMRNHQHDTPGLRESDALTAIADALDELLESRCPPLSHLW